MRKAPQLWKLEDLPGMRPMAVAVPTFVEVEKGKWMPARPLGHYSLCNRLQLAWLVFTGKADALAWPGGQ